MPFNSTNKPNHYTENDEAKTKQAAKILQPNEKRAESGSERKKNNGKRISIGWDIIVKIIYYQVQKF